MLNRKKFINFIPAKLSYNKRVFVYFYYRNPEMQKFKRFRFYVPKQKDKSLTRL